MSNLLDQLLKDTGIGVQSTSHSSFETPSVLKWASKADFSSAIEEIYKQTIADIGAKPLLGEPATEAPKQHPLTRSLSENGLIMGWKIVETISARLIEVYDDSLLLECLLDKEERIYEEWEFKKSYFADLELQIGKFFKLCYYEKHNQVMMEVKDTKGIVADDDFPQFDFAKSFGHIPIKKRV